MTDLLTRTLDRPAGAALAPELAATVAERLAVVVAPSMGRFRPAADLAAGLRVLAGELLGHVTGGRGRADEVRCPVDAEVGDVLVRGNQLVPRGHGLVWLTADPADADRELVSSDRELAP